MPLPPDLHSKTKVILCTCSSLAGARVLAALQAAANIEVVALVLSTRAFRIGQSPWGAFWFSMRQFGLRYLFYLMLATGLGNALGWLRGKNIERLARQANIRIIRTDRINSPRVVTALHALHADVLLSAFFNQVIGEEVTQSTQLGGVNIHPAKLPAFRGVDPVFYAQLRGVTSYGVTLHRIAPALDEGNILSQRDVPMADTQTVLAATVTLFEVGAACFIDAAKRAELNAVGTPQDGRGDAQYYDSWPTHDDVAVFHARGHRLCRWRDFKGKDQANTNANAPAKT